MLNTQQMEAATHLEGPLLIIAGAGTGKTTVLVNRIEEMVKRHISPENILAITFTNKAAKEMKERISNKIGEEDSKRLWASTFHSMCVKILKRNAHLHPKISPRFTIYDNTDSISVVKSIVEEMGYDKKKVIPKNIYYAISTLKNEMVDYQTYANRKPMNAYIDWEKAVRVMHDAVKEEDQEVFKKIYQAYQERLLQSNAIDFDDIILFTIDLFTARPDVLKHYQKRFKYIQVDEYQDTNRFQYILVKLLSQLHLNICVVGDDAQSIYKFRGADIRNILNFGKDYPSAKVIKLEENYRSTDVILQAANEVIANNRAQYPKNLYTLKTNGEKISNELLENEYKEAEYVRDEILKRVSRGADFKDIAILSRTNSQTRNFEQAFIQSGIPYKLIGGVGYFKRKEIKDLVSYIKLLINPDDVVAFQRIVNFPKRSIGPKTLNDILEKARVSNLSTVLANLDNIKLSKKAKEGLKSMLSTLDKSRQNLETIPADFLLRGFIQDMEIVEALMGVNEEEEKKRERISNISQLVNMAAEMVFSNDGTSLEDFLEIISLYSDTDEIDNDNAVQMLTVHASKGLEFPIVFGVGMEENLFPHERSLGDVEDIEEERRLFYVLVTRAKDKLYLTNAEMRRVFGEVDFNEPSRFLSEFSLDLLE